MDSFHDSFLAYFEFWESSDNPLFYQCNNLITPYEWTSSNTIRRESLSRSIISETGDDMSCMDVPNFEDMLGIIAEWHEVREEDEEERREFIENEVKIGESWNEMEWVRLSCMTFSFRKIGALLDSAKPCQSVGAIIWVNHFITLIWAQLWCFSQSIGFALPCN